MDYTAFNINFTDREACLSLVEDSLAAWGVSLPDDADLNLELGAGKDPDGKMVYRPYIYQAEVLESSPNTLFLKSGSVGPVSGQFRDPDSAIATWRVRQAGLDSKLKLVVPTGGSALPVSVSLTTSVPNEFRF